MGIRVQLAVALALPWAGAALLGGLFPGGFWIGVVLAAIAYVFVLRRWIQPMVGVRERVHHLAAGQGDKRAERFGTAFLDVLAEAR